MMASLPVDIDRVRAAGRRIEGLVKRTPLVQVGLLGLKCEHEQPTGSFKVRGALNRILGASPRDLAAGVVAASAGNHGLGVAFACKLRGARATVVVPEHAVSAKVAGIIALDAEVVRAQGGYAEAEAKGRELAETRGALWVSPYNDPEVIAGQGTIGLELAGQLKSVLGEAPSAEVFVPVSGGGLISGIGIALKHLTPGVKVIGVQPQASPFMYTHFKGGDMHQVVERPTIADGLAGAVEEGSITLDIVKAVVDDMQLVDEEAIREAVKWVRRTTGAWVEPSAAAAVAAALRDDQGRQRVVVLSGGNIDQALVEVLGG
jgi:threonine dehydratase